MKTLLPIAAASAALLTSTLGADQAAIEEAMVSHVIRQQNPEKIAEMMPEFEALRESFDPAASQLVQSAEEYAALVEYSKAVLASSKDDTAGVKDAITEAFWLAPSQAQFFADFLSSYRTDQKMADLQVDLQVPMKTADGTETTLAKLLEGKKGILLDFWASWCGPCVKLMPALAEKAEHLQEYDVVVASVNTDAQNAMDETQSMQKKHDFPDSMPWLLDPEGEPYQATFAIDSIPRMVLITPEGKVLYNGHPQDDALWDALKKVAPEVEKPSEV